MDQGNASQLEKLNQQIASSKLPQDLGEKATSILARLRLIEKENNFVTEFGVSEKYIEWITSLPWGTVSEDNLNLEHAKATLDKNHYGLVEVKNRILEYLSIIILQKTRGGASISHAPIISLVGLVGTGKTTIAYSVAEALGRKIERIPFGGLGGPAMLRGQSRAYPDAEPGSIVKSLRRAGTSNPVILLDEIDRVSEGARSDIMGVLVELLDPEQNKGFIDHFIDYPIDLSQVFFITTSNNTKDVSTAVLDRLEIVQMPSYSDEEKLQIGKNYMYPKILAESSLTARDIIVDDQIWEVLIRPLGYDPGIRTLQRTIQDMVRKVARLIVEGKVPAGTPFSINATNVKEFLPSW